MLQALQKRNVKARIYTCDVADQENLSTAMEKCSSDMPPIKGVFQCAMDLQDSLFERKSYEQWKNSLRPKVQGTWNLPMAVPHDVDFFITLSSFAALATEVKALMQHQVHSKMRWHLIVVHWG